LLPRYVEDSSETGFHLVNADTYANEVPLSSPSREAIEKVNGLGMGNVPKRIDIPIPILLRQAIEESVVKQQVEGWKAARDQRIQIEEVKDKESTPGS